MERASFLQNSCENEDVICSDNSQVRKALTAALLALHLVSVRLPRYYARITVARRGVHCPADVGNILPGVYVPFMAGRDWLLCFVAESGHPCTVARFRG